MSTEYLRDCKSFCLFVKRQSIPFLLVKSMCERSLGVLPMREFFGEVCLCRSCIFGEVSYWRDFWGKLGRLKCGPVCFGDLPIESFKRIEER